MFILNKGTAHLFDPNTAHCIILHNNRPFMQGCGSGWGLPGSGSDLQEKTGPAFKKNWIRIKIKNYWE